MNSNAMLKPNPFTQRSRITKPEYFVGRWRELSLVFERIEQNQPVLIAGVAGIGKSSLLTHIVQSAAANLEEPSLRAYYLDLIGAVDAKQVYATLIQGLGGTGDDGAALELALTLLAVPVVVCLDNAQHSIAAGWGDRLLESLARMVRRGDVSLVVATEGSAPVLSERFAMLQLGAFAAAEIRLLAEAYLDEEDPAAIRFSPAELLMLARLSASHPAYLQRAAFQLYRHKQDASFDWRAAYLQEAREQPIAGAPLPAAAFEGERDASADGSRYDLIDAEAVSEAPLPYAMPEFPLVLAYLVVMCLLVLVVLVVW
jgi:hypothetical protein